MNPAISLKKQFTVILRQSISSLLIGGVIFSLLGAKVRAADKTWTGSGGDNNRSTGANWGGTAPVNNDNLIFAGLTSHAGLEAAADHRRSRIHLSPRNPRLTGRDHRLWGPLEQLAPVALWRRQGLS